LPKVDEQISFENFIRALKTWREGTSTSPSGSHLGHYKYLFITDEQKYTEDYSDPKTNIMKMYYHVTIAALRSVTSLERWQTRITTMIEKIPGCSKINKLRVIYLHEAGYNLILKILWARRLVWNAHNRGKINEGQAGSRPGWNAIDVVIQKEMKYLTCRETRTGLATMDIDMKSCCNRIICNLAMIVLPYYGLLEKMTEAQAATLKRMRYQQP
jgi:hypothetical protein